MPKKGWEPAPVACALAAMEPFDTTASMADDPSTNTLRDKLYIAIGSVANAWANLEFDINETIWELANVEQTAGACITAQIVPIGGRIRSLVSLIALRGGQMDLLKKVNQFAKTADGFGRRRNRIIHDPWYIREDTKEPHQLRITADKALDFDFTNMSIDEVWSATACLSTCRCHTELLLSTKAVPKAITATDVRLELIPSKASRPRTIPAAPTRKTADKLLPPKWSTEAAFVPGGNIIRAYSDNIVPPWISKARWFQVKCSRQSVKSS
jgi:hypothetical protein